MALFEKFTETIFTKESTNLQNISIVSYLTTYFLYFNKLGLGNKNLSFVV